MLDNEPTSLSKRINNNLFHNALVFLVDNFVFETEIKDVLSLNYYDFNVLDIGLVTTVITKKEFFLLGFGLVILNVD